MKKHLILILILISCKVLGQNPVADFEVNVEYKCGYATTTFINKSVNAGTFLWDQNGRGEFWEGFEPRGSTTTSDKKWIVTLIANGNGKSDTLSKGIEVAFSKLRFDKNINELDTFAPANIQFINVSEINESDTISFSWDFGDGLYSEDENPVHTFTNPGTYDVRLNGLRQDGCELSYTDMVIVKDTAQKNEFDFIIPNCINESETSPCGYNKQYKLLNDSLIIFGYYYGNCGAVKTATVSYSVDTVKIRTWQVGKFTTCGCGFCFEIGIPNITNDSVIVTFDGENISSILVNIDDYQHERLSVEVCPNPASNFLSLFANGIDLRGFEYKIMNTTGRILKTGILKGEGQIDIENLKRGIYILLISNRYGDDEQVTKFVKE